MTAGPALEHDALGVLRASVDRALDRTLSESRVAMAGLDPLAPLLVDELARLVLAGGKRLRPAICIWGFRASLDPGAPVPEVDASSPIVRAAAALELLHTMALIHDDVMDGSPTRRGVASTPAHLAGVAAERGYAVAPDGFGRSAAILAGDLAAVLADRLILASGFDDAALARALAPYHEMRLHMAAGQLVDVAGLSSDPTRARAAARLKGGSYTVEGPLDIGAALAGAPAATREGLRAFGIPLGEAFQLRDDLVDLDQAPGATSADVNALVERAREALREAPIHPASAVALDELARRLAVP